jgi:hypothetical protein
MSGLTASRVRSVPARHCSDSMQRIPHRWTRASCGVSVLPDRGRVRPRICSRRFVLQLTMHCVFYWERSNRRKDLGHRSLWQGLLALLSQRRTSVARRPPRIETENAAQSAGRPRLRHVTILQPALKNRVWMFGNSCPWIPALGRRLLNPPHWMLYSPMRLQF